MQGKGLTRPPPYTDFILWPIFKKEFIHRASPFKLVYILKFAHAEIETFYGLVMEKFRVLSLTDYSRVMFMDYDIMPLCNMDYLFELSEAGILKENIVLGWKFEPSNAGLFVLKPDASKYKQIQSIIHRKEQGALDLPFPHWDEQVGWGHKITQDDPWIAPEGGLNGTVWNWAFAYADQGLLYYWTKYVDQSVSLMRYDVIENWRLDPSRGNTTKETTLDPNQVFSRVGNREPDSDDVAYQWAVTGDLASTRAPSLWPLEPLPEKNELRSSKNSHR